MHSVGGVKKKPRSTGLISMILGICAMFTCMVMAAIPAIVLGHMNQDETQKGQALAGLITGYITLVISILIYAFFILLLFNAPF